MVAPKEFFNKKETYLKSPLNYTGSKYKLLNQIVPLFPKEIDTFVDLFAGGCNVAINVNANKIIANDISNEIIELYNFFSASNSDKVIAQIESIIKKYKLSNTSEHGYEHYGCNSSSGVAKYNKEAYMKLRRDYNKKKTPLLFYVTLLFAFNNQIRFNSSGEFNMPVNKRDFNKNIKKNLKLFIDELGQKKIEFYSDDFKNIKIQNNSFVYIDPPYLATIASYNENGGWNEDKEISLLSYMDELNRKGIKFALSNVFENKGKSNHILKEWSSKYNVYDLDHSYNNCNYQAKDKTKNSTSEILVTNY
jgi:DNA adenine methylase Dam